MMMVTMSMKIEDDDSVYFQSLCHKRSSGTTAVNNNFNTILNIDD